MAYRAAQFCCHMRGGEAEVCKMNPRQYSTRHAHGIKILYVVYWVVLGLHRGGTLSRRPSVSSAAPASSPNTRRSLPLQFRMQNAGLSISGCTKHPDIPVVAASNSLDPCTINLHTPIFAIYSNVNGSTARPAQARPAQLLKAEHRPIGAAATRMQQSLVLNPLQQE